MMSRAQSAAHRRITSAYSYRRRPFSAPSLSGRNNRMYSRSTEIFLTGLTSDVLRMRLKQAAFFRNVSLVSFLHTHKTEIITALSRLKGIIVLVFPPENEEPDLNRWSTLLLCTVLRACDCLTIREHDDVTFLEKCYRRHFRLRPQSSGSASVRPKREWIQLCSALQRIVENVGDPVLIKSVRNFICKVEMEPRTNQAQRNMKQSLYDTIIELIEGKPGTRVKAETAEGKIVQRKLAEIQRMRQSYAEISNETWVEQNSPGKPHPLTPRLVSAVSFKSPYDENLRKNYNMSHKETKLGKDKSLGSDIANMVPMRVSPNMGKDISARVAYQQKFQFSDQNKYDKQTRSKLVTNRRPNTAPEVQMDLRILQKGNEPTKPMSSYSIRATVQIPDEKKPVKSSTVQCEKQTNKDVSVNVKAGSGKTDKQSLSIMKDTHTNNERQSKSVHRDRIYTNGVSVKVKPGSGKADKQSPSTMKETHANNEPKSKSFNPDRTNTNDVSAKVKKGRDKTDKQSPGTIKETHANIEPKSKSFHRVRTDTNDVSVKVKSGSRKTDNQSPGTMKETHANNEPKSKSFNPYRADTNDVSVKVKKGSDKTDKQSPGTVKERHADNEPKSKSFHQDRTNTNDMSRKTFKSESQSKVVSGSKRKEASSIYNKTKEQDQRPSTTGLEKFETSDKSRKTIHDTLKSAPVHLSKDSKPVTPTEKFRNKHAQAETDNNMRPKSKAKETVKGTHVTKAKPSKGQIVNNKLATAQNSVKMDKIVVNKHESGKAVNQKKEAIGAPLDDIDVLNRQNIQKAGLRNREQTLQTRSTMPKRNQSRPVSKNSETKPKQTTVSRGSKTANTRVVSAASGKKTDKERGNKTPRKVQNKTQSRSSPSQTVNKTPRKIQDQNSTPSQSVNVTTNVTQFDQDQKENNETKKTAETTKQPSENIPKKQQIDHEKEMKKITMEVLVHQNVKSVVGHKLFKSKDTIDEFFNFLYKHQVMKKFLKSFHLEPYKKWETTNGKPEYFCFLHCFIFRHIDPNKDKEVLYVVEKILTRMQCQHLRTPRSFTPLGSIFKGRKSLLQEALEYSRSKTAPDLQNKSRPPSRNSSSNANSPHPFARSYAGTSSKGKNNIGATSRSLSLERGKGTPAFSSRCWKCKQKDLAMKISTNWGNKCVCELLQKEDIHYKLDHLLPAVKVNDLGMIKEIVDSLKERNEWNPEDSKAKDALYKSRKLRIKSLVKYFEGEGVEDERLAVQTVCVTCRLFSA